MSENPSGHEGSDVTPLTRRDLLQASAFLGVGGLGLGAAAGFGVGRAGGGGGVLAASGSGSGAVGDTSPLRVVAPLALAGAIAATAEEVRAGAEIAIDEINALGGVLGRPLEYDELDIGESGDASQVRAAWTRVVETMEPDVLVTNGAIAMGPDLDVSAAAGVIYLNGNTRADWGPIYESNPEFYWSVFQVDPDETAYGTGFALFLDQLVNDGKLEAPRKDVAIIAGDDPYGTHIADTFQRGIQEYGWSIHSRGSVTAGTVVDWGPVLSNFRASPPAVVFSTDFAVADNANMIKQWVQSPLPSLLYQQYAPSEAEYLELTGDAANGVIWSTVLGLQADQISDNFRAVFRERYGREPSWAYAGHAYDCVWLWAKAAAMSGDPNDTRKVAALIEQSIHRGVTGGISFPSEHTVPSYPSEIGDPSLGQPHVIAQIRDGQHIQIYPEPYTAGEFELPPWM